MNLRALLFAAMVTMYAGCSSTPAPVVNTTAQDEAAIKALEDRFVAAFDAKDVN